MTQIIDVGRSHGDDNVRAPLNAYEDQEVIPLPTAVSIPTKLAHCPGCLSYESRIIGIEPGGHRPIFSCDQCHRRYFAQVDD